MKRGVTLALALLLLSAAALGAHDLFLKLRTFLVAPNSAVRVLVLNGTFSTSENSITRDRIADLSLAGPDSVAKLDTTRWSARGDTSVLAIQTGRAGTYVVGVSTRPRALALEARDFNEYLETDGVPDILAARRQRGELHRNVKERYSKHVKAVIQAGQARSAGVEVAFGYPAELVPLDNPYALGFGRTLRLRALVDGAPVANQFVLAGGRTAGGARLPQRSYRTDAEGLIRVPLRSRGTWYVKFIHMTPLTGDTAADYESKWATLTFQVR